MQGSCVDVNSPFKRKCWNNSGGPLVNLLLRDLTPYLTHSMTTAKNVHIPHPCFLKLVNTMAKMLYIYMSEVYVLYWRKQSYIMLLRMNIYKVFSLQSLLDNWRQVNLFVWILEDIVYCVCVGGRTGYIHGIQSSLWEVDRFQVEWGLPYIDIWRHRKIKKIVFD